MASDRGHTGAPIRSAVERPSLLAPGDVVRFEPIMPEQYEAIRADVAANRYTPPSAEMRE